MANATNYLENKVLDHTLGKASFTMPSTVYLALFTTNPTDAMTGTEVTGNGYSRKAVSFGAASSGSSANDTQFEFDTATANWPQVGWWAVMDAATSGNGLYHGALDSPFTVLEGQQFRVRVGDIVISAD